ncbi:helix-turn-helix domain-containing protein [Mycolicibacterium palauense]|uniref:helix-turn-helix domain-containing protein n=1 Tax=Mycolicibacterium palauense TaxID=2034511 RepID=UPI00389917EF
MDAVRRCTGITAERRIVIMHIGATADKDGKGAWRDNRTVAAEVAVSEDTVTRARRDGIEHGLWVETRAARGGRGGAGRTAEYRLVIPGKVRTDAGDSWERSAAVPEKVRTAAGKGPQESTEKVRTAADPSGISSGISSGVSSGDPWGDPPTTSRQGDAPKITDKENAA